jgi:uncharacterized protein (TIGR02246 family)
MKQILIVLFFCALNTCLVSAQNASSTQIERIKAARETSNKAIAAHDLAGIAQFWRDDFVQVRGNASFLSGKENILASWKKLFDENQSVKYVRTPAQIIISTNDTLAWETGTWKAFNSYSKGGKYSAMWRKTNNNWLLQSELFVSLY